MKNKLCSQSVHYQTKFYYKSDLFNFRWQYIIIELHLCTDIRSFFNAVASSIVKRSTWRPHKPICRKYSSTYACENITSRTITYHSTHKTKSRGSPTTTATLYNYTQADHMTIAMNVTPRSTSTTSNYWSSGTEATWSLEATLTIYKH